DEEQVYFKDMLCMRARGRDDATPEKNRVSTILFDKNGNVYKGSLFEHMLLMHVTVACDVGDHGNMLLRGADWNDALDMAPEKGESVAFTAAYAGNLREMADFLENKGGEVSLLKELWTLTERLHGICIKTDASVAGAASEKREALSEYCSTVSHCVSGEKVKVSASDLSEKLRDISESIISHIRQNEMLKEGDLSWINGYYDNEGKPAESLKEGRIMLTGAVFAIMSSAAGKEDVAGMIKTADKYLFSRESGGYRLNIRYPDEGYYAHNMGRMFGFAYGSKENGAVFCHMDVMYAYALLERGFRNEAVKVVAGLLRQSMDFEKSRMYPGIPEYFDMNGRGMYPYLTGAASWLLLFLYRLGKDGRQ
ncbi:MAG: cellobiose phosphorylase, partial [Lachnospiraceae bacterium]|nr:cellobiose phosphorylase [Lachnospiraceae bacterium]